MAARNATRLWRPTISSVRLGIAFSTQIHPRVVDVAEEQRWKQQSSANARPGREAKSPHRRLARRLRAEGEVGRAAGTPQQFGGKD